MEKFGEVRHDDAVKRAIRKTTDVVNAIFEGIFKFEEDTDIFRKLVEKEDINKDYETKKNQLKYAKLIREVKQVDLNKAVRQERRLIKDLQKLNNKYIKQKMLEKAQANRSPEIAQIEIDMMRLRAENKDFAKRLTILENVEKLNSAENEEIRNARDKVVAEAKDEIKAYEIELRRKFAEERSNLRKEYKDALREQTKMQQREEKAIIAREENVARIIQANQEKTISKLATDKDALEKRYNAILQEEKERNERELKALEERNRRKKEALEQEERERVAQMKVKAYEERKALEEEISKLQKNLNG